MTIDPPFIAVRPKHLANPNIEWHLPVVQTDALSDVLAHIGVRGTVFCRAEVGAPWGLSTSGGSSAIFHVIVRGGGYIRVEGEDRARPWRAGDLLLLPHGHAHVMSDDASTVATPLRDLATEASPDGLPCVVHGGDGPRSSILCGSFALGASAKDLLLGSLPPLIHVQSSTETASAWLDSTLRLLADEVAGGRPGSETVVARLAEILLVHSLRTWLAASESSSGWLAGLRDPVVARALGAIHDQPARDWTAATLARVAGVSRTGLYERFSTGIGESPAAYLSRWRMELARRHLRERPRDGIAEVAEAVGYASEAAFSRAFKRVVGQSPSAWRRSA